MAYTPATRNRTGIQFASHRDGFDQTFEAVHDALSAAYYDNWKLGTAFPWTYKSNTYNVVNGTPRIRFQGGGQQTFPGMTAKQFFDDLHGMLHAQYAIRFHAMIEALPEAQRPPPEKYDMTDRAAKAAQAQLVIDDANGRGIVMDPID